MKKKFLNIIILNIFVFIGLISSLFSNTIQPGPRAYDEIQKALIFSKPGDLIQLSEGIFEFEDGLSLDIDNVTVAGEGEDKTILSFKLPINPLEF